MDQLELDRTINQLRKRGADSATTEVKASAGRLARSTWDTVSAFANTRGGAIIFGLDEKAGFTPAFGFDPVRIEDQLISGLGDGDPAGACVDPCPSYELEDSLTVDGAPVLVVTIQALEPGAKPCYVRAKGVAGGSFKRVGDHDRRLTQREIYSLMNEITRSIADWQPVPDASEADLSTELVEGLFTHEAHSRMFKGAATDHAKLVRAKVIDSKGRPTLAGLLSCGSYPQQFFPRLCIDVAVHPGTQKGDPSSPLRFLDRRLCEGAIGEMVEEAFQAVRKNLRIHSFIQGLGRIDQLEIPPEAIREALSNAVVHRAYDELFLGQSIQVDLYANRIEVINPGGLWGGKSLENIANGISECRNEVLLRLLGQMPAPGIDGLLVEGNGTGVLLMQQAMEAYGLKPPTFDAGIDYFKVILWREDINENGHLATPLAKHATEDAPALDRASSPDTTQRRYWSPEEWRTHILALLQRSGPLTALQIAEALDRKAGITRAVLRQLSSAGLIEIVRVPESRGRAYALQNGSTS